ncbi:hypothetical protein DFR58_1336 [Anaerobacterium chartisolvens]|uniref:C-deglycosylation enzyme beta subunit n=1 Tax=Anaerobacterium chartisolvens TaxID=1297424 RepID=A0A369ANV7_9FIRM|nr:DUF6379 domain-containing protein [Anaerobacterium chartisolvens]RCX09867.1 hypothetical protein DFR58_1336 [Anaerobacterium chartisolvens]
MVLDFQYDELLLPYRNIINKRAGDVCYGYAIQIRYPSYRGTFVSCIEKLELQVDGKSIPESDMRFVLNGKEFLVSQLGELSKEHWFVLDTANIVVLRDNGLTEGNHEISVRMVHRIPYTGYFGQYLVLDSVNTKTLCCRNYIN